MHMIEKRRKASEAIIILKEVVEDVLLDVGHAPGSGIDIPEVVKRSGLNDEDGGYLICRGVLELLEIEGVLVNDYQGIGAAHKWRHSGWT